LFNQWWSTIPQISTKWNNHISSQTIEQQKKRKKKKTIMIYGFENSDPVLGQVQQYGTWYYPCMPSNYVPYL
jgi:hypothetical protein